MDHIRGCLLQLVEIRRKKYSVINEHDKQEKQEKKVIRKESNISLPSHPSLAIEDETKALPQW